MPGRAGGRLKYQVRLAERVFQVEVDGDRVRVNGREVHAALLGVPRSPLRRLVIDGKSRTLALIRTSGGWQVQDGGVGWTAEVLDERAQSLQEMVGQPAQRTGGGTVRAPMPGLVLRVEVEVGQAVQAGHGLVVLEAMKMENEIRSPSAGTVQRVLVKPGQAVEKGTDLVEIG